MEIQFIGGLRVSHKELSKLFNVKPSQLKKTIEQYHKHFEDYGFLYESAGEYYLSYPQCEVAVLFTVSSNLEARSLFSKLNKEFANFKKSY
ncbi:MAG: hypothetical protein RLZZ507_3609 [Cyanobacteriota bacterium]|jgi:hypothetical protein